MCNSEEAKLEGSGFAVLNAVKNLFEADIRSFASLRMTY